MPFMQIEKKMSDLVSPEGNARHVSRSDVCWYTGRPYQPMQLWQSAPAEKKCQQIRLICIGS